MGIGRNFQIIKVFGEMTVAENLLVAKAQSRGPGFQPFWMSRRFDRQFRERLDAILELTGLAALRRRRGHTALWPAALAGAGRPCCPILGSCCWTNRWPASATTRSGRAGLILQGRAGGAPYC